MSLTLNERIVATTDALWTVVVHLNSQLDPICQIIGRVLIQAQQQRFRICSKLLKHSARHGDS